MTLVVARNDKGRIAIAADTRVTEHGSPLPIQRGTIKSCMLPGEVCVSFSNSPVTAAHAFKKFISKYPNGTGYSEVLSFFEQSSAETGNDYLIAFSRNPRIEKVVDGKRVHSIAKTAWIGDKSAYERFREYEAKHRPNIEHPRAMNAVYFADELQRSPASDLYSTMRNIVADQTIPSVGGFVSVVSNRDNGFRFSVYSDVLFDWPREKTTEYFTNLNDPITLDASGRESWIFCGPNLAGIYEHESGSILLCEGEDIILVLWRCRKQLLWTCIQMPRSRSRRGERVTGKINTGNRREMAPHGYVGSHHLRGEL
jgi:hypothetical protein